VLLEQARANLQSWRSVVDAEYTSVLRGLLLRVAFIGLALLVLFIVSQVWQHMTVKYVQDLRRRRTILITRRIVTGFFTGIVLIFGFVTQFSSLATFAGFITAGIAVGLQTILLSVAAYFFIVGRYGVRVGDRITVAGVTGDVVEVGLVRFYMMELAGTSTGTGLHPTGRIAVFANSVLFQAGTPLYKQVPGTEYGWHELTVRLNPDTDYHAATKLILASVQGVYEGYRARIEGQHKLVEAWMDTAMETPHVEPRLQLAETGLQYAVLFPVEIKDAATTDEQIVRKLLSDVAENEAVKNAIVSPPTVKAVIKNL
jgi:small-conductance mechanosensitive channel